ncbi:MAG: hypothetical protein ABI557_02135, partial [Aureliella sp.]
LPKPSLTPEDVVREQVESLRGGVANSEALMTCFSFASPSNRELTGPFQRFAKLVNAEPYRQIGVCREYQIGRAMFEGSAAHVLVSILSDDGQGLAFEFLLSKQSNSPYRDCWMTDGVVPLPSLKMATPRSVPLPNNAMYGGESNNSESNSSASNNSASLSELAQPLKRKDEP